MDVAALRKVQERGHGELFIYLPAAGPARLSRPTVIVAPLGEPWRSRWLLARPRALDEQRRMTIPRSIAAQWKLRPGDVVWVAVGDGELRLPSRPYVSDFVKPRVVGEYLVVRLPVQVWELLRIYGGDSLLITATYGGATVRRAVTRRVNTVAFRFGEASKNTESVYLRAEPVYRSYLA